MSGHNEVPMSGTPTINRRCLKCWKWFASEWNGNRLCHKCNKQNESADQPARCERQGGQTGSFERIETIVKRDAGKAGAE